MPDQVDLKRRREFCPWCGAENFDCEKPSECQREIQSEERDSMEREAQAARERIEAEYGYGY